MIDVRKLIRAQHRLDHDGSAIYSTKPAKGILFVTEDNPSFISGHVRMRGKDEGRYPFKYVEMIDQLFGPEQNTIEVCSRSVSDCYTVDINPECKADMVADGQMLEEVADNSFARWRCDPPYNHKTAKEMYNTELPNTAKLLKAGARVCKSGSLMFLLLGPQNYQAHPKSVKRIGFVAITIVPNNELRALNIYYKF